jgi:glycosyltransferase involved in cell wall biosynthesis
MRTYYNRAKILVAPLFLGTGLQNKILEAMAMNVPVITSAIVNASIKANSSQITECHNFEDFNDSILALLNDSAKRAEQSKNAQEFVRQNFNWQTHTNKLSKLFTATP